MVREDHNSVRGYLVSVDGRATDNRLFGSLDNEGLAIIMCASNMEQRYKALTSGTTILESCLHLNLTEHLNSEVGLGTITSTESAKTWLHNSFLFQRLQRNPSHYALGKSTTQTWQERLDDLVSDSVKSLCDAELIRAKNDWTGQPNALEATEYGEIMSKVRRSVS